MKTHHRKHKECERMALSSKVERVEPSITLAISAEAKKMKAAGITDVIALSAGEPDFNTPAHICEAAVKAINEGYTRYTPASGIPELKEAVCAKFKNDNGLEYKSDQVIINCGAKHSVFLAVFTLVDDGEEVIVPAPYWVSYPEMVKLAGGVPVIIPCSEATGLKMSAEQFEAAITPKTKLLILNSPSNPSGMVYTKQELADIAAVAEKHGIYILSDEIYEKLVYDGEEHVSIASFSDAMYERAIVVNGVSKAYCMTGWRIGYTAGPKDIISGMAKVQSQETSNPTSISQKAALAALNGSTDFLVPMLAEYDKRRRYVTDRLNAIDGVSCTEPKGAFYVYPNVSGHYGRSFEGEKVSGSVKLCEYMLADQHIALVPGEGFGTDANCRISYAVSMAELEEALDRFEKGLAKLS